MIIDTLLDVKHIELIEIFLKANELVGATVYEYPMEIRGRHHMCLRIESKFEDTDVALTFMGVRHTGIKNMLDDYLMKCGVPVSQLIPSSIKRQEQEEREAEQNAAFMEQLEKLSKSGNLKKIYENSNQR